MLRDNNVENIRLLLEAGANPDGVAVKDMLWYATHMSNSCHTFDGNHKVTSDLDEQEMWCLLQDAWKQNAVSLPAIQQRRDVEATSPSWCLANAKQVEALQQTATQKRIRPNVAMLRYLHLQWLHGMVYPIPWICYCSMALMLQHGRVTKYDILCR